MVDHTIVHSEIPADDVEKLGNFYSGLFVWKTEKMPSPMEYWGIETVPVDEKRMTTHADVNSGMIKKQNLEHKPANYIAVESIKECVRKTDALGGEALVPRMEVPGVGWWALALDSEGNRFAIFQST